MEPINIVRFEANTYGLFSSYSEKEIPSGLCQATRDFNGNLEVCTYYKNNGLINFAFIARMNTNMVYIGADYTRGTGFLQTTRKSYALTYILGEETFRASREEVVELFLDKRHHMSDWLLFNQDLWNHA